MDQKNKSEWWSDSRFWKDFGPLMFDTERRNSAVEEVDGILTLTGEVPPGRILDLGCGPGRHSAVLAARGFTVTGIDINDSYLDEARSLTEKIVPEPEFLNCDLRDFRSSEPYAGAISMFQSIGYFDDPDEDLKVCIRVCDALESGGWFLIEMDGKEALASSFEERTWLERDNRIILLEYEVEAAWSRLRNRWMFRDSDGSWHEYEFSYRLYSALELGRMLESAGFASIEFFGALDSRPYNHEAIRLVALARRP